MKEVLKKQLLILKLIPWGFYPMLLYQDKVRQERAKKFLKKAILTLVKD